MTRRLARSLTHIAAAAALWTGLCAYAPSSNQFHIDMGATAASWTVDKEILDDTSAFVLFKFTPATGAHGATGERFVVWHRIGDLIPDIDGFASSLAQGILADRYPAGHFQIATRIKSRGADGRAYYVFTAKGLYKDVPALWTGVIQYFPLHGAAIAADLHSLNGDDVRTQLGITDTEIVTWGVSLKPGE